MMMDVARSIVASIVALLGKLSTVIISNIDNIASATNNETQLESLLH